jgi:hypothetical protein
LASNSSWSQGKIFEPKTSFDIRSSISPLVLVTIQCAFKAVMAFAGLAVSPPSFWRDNGNPALEIPAGPDKFYKSRICSSSQARAIDQGWFWSSAAWSRFGAQPSVAVWISPPSGFHRVAATKPVRPEIDKQTRCQVPSIVLSETRGL